TVTLAIGDFDAITLDYEKDVTANAQALYDRRKGALAKAQRVDEATGATRAEMEAAQAKAVKVAKRPRIKSTKSMWFEAYRWTISSEGFLILGGRDARTNDQLVKKHLKEGDRYAHADVHGAPSTVIKDGARATEATLREACEFALSYSKAWSAGLASGSAYWVLSEQVSKQAESGEFLPRGAFVIRGKRNYFPDLPVRIAIGEVEVEGHRKIMGGPVTAVAARSVRYQGSPGLAHRRMPAAGELDAAVDRDPPGDPGPISTGGPTEAVDPRPPLGGTTRHSRTPLLQDGILQPDGQPQSEHGPRASMVRETGRVRTPHDGDGSGPMGHRAGVRGEPRRPPDDDLLGPRG